MYRNNKLANSVRLALLFGAASTAATGAVTAQEQASESAERVERISVTGSRIRSTDLETAQPIDTISREDIANQGFTSVTDILDNMSTSGAPPLSRSAPLSSGEAAGGNYANLRNLGANRTLVLVNGRRLGITTGGLQDLSAIPVSMIERIEVLKDGASTMYGSDAMAGVINVITRTNFEGMEVTLYGGEYSDGDGGKKNISLVGGMSGDRGSVTFGVEWRDENGVWARDRDFSAVGFPERDIPQNRTLVGQYGRFFFEDQWWIADRPGAAMDFDTDFVPQTQENGTSNPNDAMHLLAPLSARSIYLNANYDLTNNTRFTTDIGYSERKSTRQVDGYPLQSTSTFGAVNGWFLDADSYFNPVGEDVRFTRRGREVPRVSTSDNSTLRFVGALEGSFDVGSRYFDWDVGALYSQSQLLQTGRGDFQIPNVVAATGPSFMNDAGQVQCGTPDDPIALANCTPWNPLAGWGAGTVENSLDDPNVQDFLFPTSHATGETTTVMYFANLSGLLAELPAGDLTFAVGAEYRDETGLFRPDALAQAGLTSTLAAGATQGSYDVSEVYAEINVPLLMDVTGARELSLNAATRYSDYSTFGDTTNSKLGLVWRPVDDLLIRGTWSEGFRAPTVSNLFGGGSQTFTTGFVDPCDSEFGVAAGTARCLQDVPADYRQLQQGFIPTQGPSAQTPVPFVSGSNPNLQPEESESYTLGFVYSPQMVEGLDIILDYWKIDITSTMVSDSPNAILDDCYVGLDESRCALFARDPSTFIVNDLEFGLRNAGFTKTSGYDLALRYRFDTADFGAFRLNLDTTYVDKYDTRSSDAEDARTTPNVGYGSTFRVRSNAGVNWTMGDFSANWNIRYYSSIKERCTFTDRCNIPEFSAPWTNDLVTPYHKNGSTTFNDVQVSYSTPWDSTVSVGANNVFDRQGPILYSGPSSNFSYYGGFDIGRFWYVRYTQRF